MLYKSGNNLEKGAIEFINNNRSITLFSAYIKLEELIRINTKNNIKQIIVRWEVEDLCKGVSDIELYQYCINNEIALYRNTRLHMKVFWNNEDILLLGSANITGRGLGEVNDYNYELNGTKDSLSLDDIIYLNRVIASSEYVSVELYLKLNELVKNVILPTLIFPEIPTIRKEIDYFLISQLPMCISPDDFYRIALNSKDFDYLEQNCVAHDIALFEIDPFQEYNNFKLELRNKFNSHPFIIALKCHIKEQNSQSMRYGGVVKWIQNNTTTVPTPRSWELKQEQFVNILYTWICDFDEQFIWDTPNHSQVIYYIK